MSLPWALVHNRVTKWLVTEPASTAGASHANCTPSPLIAARRLDGANSDGVACGWVAWGWVAISGSGAV